MGMNSAARHMIAAAALRLKAFGIGVKRTILAKVPLCLGKCYWVPVCVGKCHLEIYLLQNVQAIKIAMV